MRIRQNSNREQDDQINYFYEGIHKLHETMSSINTRLSKCPTNLQNVISSEERHG